MKALLSSIPLLVWKKSSVDSAKLFAPRLSQTKNPFLPSAFQKGFTLLEVMVALAILAVVAVTASQASRSYLNAVANVKTRMLAHYVAQNTLADMRINQVWITQPETRQVQENGRQWQVTITPTHIPALDSSAMTDSIRPITIAVAPVAQAGTATGGQNSISTLEAVISKPAGNLP